MRIRKATVQDAEQIAEVLVSFYNLDNKEEAKQTFTNERVKGHQYIVAEENSRIIGLVTWLVHGLPKHMLAELDRIVLLPESRGKGIGKKLFEALKKDADNFYKKHGFKLRKLYLLTHADNKEAQSFYESIGFRHETTLKQHYYKDKDEFVYSMFF
ncbi:GNAT family N-acetyltransferase [Candidatus Woesearchaeota archaeon]|nr:GNAT family N-acetyltransferase [Candidatus Woesearchaeota archaeon]